MRSLAIALTLVVVGCAHQEVEPSRDRVSRPVDFQSLCRAASPQAPLAMDPSEAFQARTESAERLAADAKAALAQLDQAAQRDPDLLYGRERDEFLRSREQCVGRVLEMQRLKDRLVAQHNEAQREELVPLPEAKPVKQAKAKAKHRKSVRVAAVASSTW
jgi:hypothetical protein